jgi:hypothetical protein
MVFMEILIQTVIWVYCHYVTYIDLSNIHLGSPGLRLEHVTQSYQTGLYKKERNLPDLYNLNQIS